MVSTTAVIRGPAAGVGGSWVPLAAGEEALLGPQGTSFAFPSSCSQGHAHPGASSKPILVRCYSESNNIHAPLRNRLTGSQRNNKGTLGLNYATLP